MPRLNGFDYKSPYFYMVTLKRLKCLAPFSEIGPDGLVKNDITRAFESVIESFHLKWRCLEPISPFVVMPDHIHLMVKIKDVLPRKSLAVLIWQLTRALSKEYWRVTSDHSRFVQNPEPQQSSQVLRGAAAPAPKPPPIFDHSWHDWVVKRDGQLAAFRRYIRENPARAWARKANAAAGGRLIVLSPEGFGPRWHPPREKERFCAEGRMLFLSLYEASTRQPTRKELYDRCHEMVDLAILVTCRLESGNWLMRRLLGKQA